MVDNKIHNNCWIENKIDITYITNLYLLNNLRFLLKRIFLESLSGVRNYTFIQILICLSIF